MSIVAAGYEGVLSSSTFGELPLPDWLQQGVALVGWTRPSVIQANALPYLLRADRPSLLGQSKNGTGKTGAFGLAMLAAVDPNVKAPQALCLAPTRLLAVQIAKVLERLRSMQPAVSVKLLVGGMGQKLTEPVTAQVIVGTDQRVSDLINRRLLDVRGLRVLALDEADDMLDSRRAPNVSMVKKAAPRAQVLLFSASFECFDGSRPGAVEAKRLADFLLRRPDGAQPIEIRVSSLEKLANENVTQFIAAVSSIARAARSSYGRCAVFIAHLLPRPCRFSCSCHPLLACPPPLSRPPTCTTCLIS